MIKHYPTDVTERDWFPLRVHDQRRRVVHFNSASALILNVLARLLRQSNKPFGLRSQINQMLMINGAANLIIND